MAKAPLPSGGQHSFQRPNNIRPQGAAKPVVPSRDGIPGHNCKAKTHVPSVHGLLSGRKVASKTYVPSRDGPVSAKIKEVRAEKAARMKNLHDGWTGDTGMSETEEAMALKKKLKEEEEEAKFKEEEDKIQAKAWAHFEKKKKKEQKKREMWRSKMENWKAKKKMEKEAKINALNDAAEAKIRAQREAEEEEERLRLEALEETDSDDDSDEESADAEAARKEEEAMEKAADGNFVVDICVVCAFGLPKVDYWGSVDSYIRPTWDGELNEEGDDYERKVMPGIKWDFKKNRGKGDLSQVKIVGKELAIRNSQTPRFDFHFQIDFTKAENEDAELFIEIWDYDKSGDDDIISRVELDSQDIRERACTTIATRKQGKFDLQPIPGAIGKAANWGIGNLTLQFKMRSDVNYMEEAQKKAFGRTKKSYIHNKIRTARDDFAV